MKKLHLVMQGYGRYGHNQEYIRNFSSKLSQSFDIYLYVPHTENHGIPEGVTPIYINCTINNYVLNLFSRIGFFKNEIGKIKSMFTSFKFCKNILKQNSIGAGDIVFVMDYTPLSLIAFFKNIEKEKVQSFLWIHSARFDSKDFIYKTYKTLVKGVFKIFVKRKLTGVIVNGDFIKPKISEILNYDLDKIHVIQYPSEIEYAKYNKTEARKILKIKDSEKVVLSFGNLRKDKNIEEVIKSTALAKSQPLLIIAGSESTVSKKDIDYWIKKHSHKNYLLDIKYISEEQMAIYYSASDVLLLTYGSESASQSGPLSLARQFDLPAIVTDTGEIGYYVKTYGLGLVASAHEEGDFAKKIDMYFENDKERKKYISNIEKSKLKFSWNTAASNYKILFSD